MGGRVAWFEIGTIYSGTIINYHLFQKFKLLVNDEFNYLTIVLTGVTCNIGLWRVLYDFEVKSLGF